MASDFKLVPTNPNPSGGCLCSETGCSDSQPPYASFYVTEMESLLSPIPVVCGNCIKSLGEAAEKFDEEHAPEV